jgi:3-deoxy-D-manno-octulosonic-acid transferase
VSLAWTAYRLLAPALGAIAPSARVFASPRERALWRERMGLVPSGGECHAWIHAASLGESVAVGPLLRALQAFQPDARFRLTATTRTGRERLSRIGPPASLAPIDAPQAVRRFLHAARPRRLVLVETELWPHWLLAARKVRLPVIVASARLSGRSVRHYRGLGGEFRNLLTGLHAVLCQTEEDAERWRVLGARPERVAVAGNLKHDALPDQVPDRAAARGAHGLDRARPVLVLGSLRPGEAGLIARTWRALPESLRSGWQVVAVPRHPIASAGLRSEAAHHGITFTSAGVPGGDLWRWDDSLGVLTGYYAAADLAIVCGSLFRYGGHNPMEAAACGAAVIVGPHHASQLQSVRVLSEMHAARVLTSTRELLATLRELMTNGGHRENLGRRGLEAVRSMRGAARRTSAQLVAWDLWPVS